MKLKLLSEVILLFSIFTMIKAINVFMEVHLLRKVDLNFDFKQSPLVYHFHLDIITFL